VDGDPPLFEIDIGPLQMADLGRTKPVAIGQEKDRLVTPVLDDGKETLEFLLGEELHRA
jgi:hypothetical protein